MTTITISLPDQTAEKIDREAAKHGYATRSEFVRSLIRRYLVEEKETVVFREFKPRSLKEIRKEFKQTGKYTSKFIDSLIEGLSGSSVYARKTTKK